MNIDDFPFHDLADSSDTQEDLVNHIRERMADIGDVKKIIRMYVDLGILDPKWLPKDFEFTHAPYIPLLMTDRVGELEQLTSNHASRYGQGIDNHLYKKITITET